MQDRESQRLISLAGPLLTGALKGESRESTAQGGITLDQVRSALAAAISTDGEKTTDTALIAADLAIAQATSAVKAAREAGNPQLSIEQRSSLEAIVCVTGRPSMRYRDGMVQQPIGDATANERWLTMLGRSRADINSRSASVGRVGLTTAGGVLPLGTAWRVGRDLVVTNKHVAIDLVANSDAPIASWKLDAARPSVVEFGCFDNTADPLTTSITEFVYCSESEDADLALLRVKSERALPAPLAIEWSVDVLGQTVDQTFKGRDVYIVGHPYVETTTAVEAAIFVRADGLKRCAPGQVMTLNASGPGFEHDCSTLAGNSGSCIFTTDTHKVVGLHVGGRGVNDITRIAKANVALAMGRLSQGQFAELVKS